MFDFLNAERAIPEEAQLYLHRAAELALGTHDHWNNPIDRQYSKIDFQSLELAVNRTTIDRLIRSYRNGQSTEQDVKAAIRGYTSL